VIVGKIAKSFRNTATSMTLSQLVDGLGATSSGEVVTPDSAKSIDIVYRAGNILSDDVAKLPFQQIQRVGRSIEQVKPDAFLRNNAYLLEVTPNEWGWTPFLFKKQIILWQFHHGNAYIWSPPVWPPQKLILPADRTKPVFDTAGNLWYRHTFTNGQTEYIPGVEILQLLINPDETGMEGRGVIQYARETIGRQLAAFKTQGKFYAQGLNPSAYITVNSPLDATGRAKYRDSYGEAMSGTNNAYRLAVFDSKITSFQPITMKPADAEFLESIDANDVRLATFCGIPLHMLNRGKEAYNSNEQKYIEYLQGSLDAYLVPFEQGARRPQTISGSCARLCSAWTQRGAPKPTRSASAAGR
jgi:HK97 family phage portal protein